MTYESQHSSYVTQTILTEEDK